MLRLPKEFHVGGGISYLLNRPHMIYFPKQPSARVKISILGRWLKDTKGIRGNKSLPYVIYLVIRIDKQASRHPNIPRPLLYPTWSEISYTSVLTNHPFYDLSIVPIVG